MSSPGINDDLCDSDCSATGNSLWLKYLGSALGSLAKIPPKAGAATLTTNVKSSLQDFKADVAKDRRVSAKGRARLGGRAARSA